MILMLDKSFSFVTTLNSDIFCLPVIFVFCFFTADVDDFVVSYENKILSSFVLFLSHFMTHFSQFASRFFCSLFLFLILTIC